jgi:cell volume regulation protein A
MFIARPVAIFLLLSLSKMSYKEKAMISWVGLKGAVPIVLATIPLLAGLSDAETIFNIVFFIVMTSVLLQGSSITFVAKLLGVESPVGPELAQDDT